MATPFSLVRGIPPPRGYGPAFDEDSDEEEVPAHCTQLSVDAEMHDVQPPPVNMFSFVPEVKFDPK